MKIVCDGRFFTVLKDGKILAMFNSLMACLSFIEVNNYMASLRRSA